MVTGPDRAAGVPGARVPVAVARVAGAPAVVTTAEAVAVALTVA
jgi:hypothetical protein